MPPIGIPNNICMLISTGVRLSFADAEGGPQSCWLTPSCGERGGGERGRDRLAFSVSTLGIFAGVFAIFGTPRTRPCPMQYRLNSNDLVVYSRDGYSHRPRGGIEDMPSHEPVNDAAVFLQCHDRGKRHFGAGCQYGLLRAQISRRDRMHAGSDGDVDLCSVVDQVGGSTPSSDSSARPLSS